MNIIIIINLTNTLSAAKMVSGNPGAVLATGSEGTTGRRRPSTKGFNLNCSSTANAMSAHALGSGPRHFPLNLWWNLCAVLAVLIFVVVVVPPIPIIALVAIPGMG